jgi:archaellum component FlaC
MEQKQLDRMENMLSNLIKIVGTLNSDFQGMKVEMQGMKVEMQGMKEEIQDVKEELQDVKKDIEKVKNEQAVTNSILTDMRADQDHIWEKAAKNERELAKLKRHLHL